MDGVGSWNQRADLIQSIHNHLHSWESWFAAAAVPDGEDHVADNLTTSQTAFQADANNDDWGSWLQVLGADDTPVRTGKVKYDLHRILVTAVERFSHPHVIQVAFGTSGAAALAAGTYTEIIFAPAGANAQETPVDIRIEKQAAGTKAWLRVFVPGQDTGTMNFFIGLHEYSS